MYESIKAHKYAFLVFFFIFVTAFIVFYDNIIIDSKFATLLVSVTLTYTLFNSILLWLIENRYIKVREQLALINSKMQYLYHLAYMSNKEFFESFKKALDNYIIAEVEFSLKGYQKTQERSNELFYSLDQFKMTSKKSPAIFNNMVNVLFRFLDNRETIELYSRKILIGQMKFLYNLLTFSTLFIFLIAVLTLNSIYSFIFVIYLFFFIYFTYFIKDIDNLNLDKLFTRHQSRKQLFDLLNLPPFCPNEKYLKYNVYNLKIGDKYRIRDEKGKIVVKIIE